MNKELTLSQTNQMVGDHWAIRPEMGKLDIDSIVDPEGGKTKEMPTSIPSPFARMDLVRAAFANVARLQGKSSPNDQKLVSEALDIAQIFFNYENLKSKISIVRWDKKLGLESLLYSPSDGHNNFGVAIELFLEQDGGIGKVKPDDDKSGGYNFDFMKSLFILKYEDENWSGIIGGTSPSTLFFSSPNDLSKVDIRFDNDKLFDEELCPLYKRDKDFQISIYALSKLPNFSNHFPEVHNYVQFALAELSKVNRPLSKEIGDNCINLTDTYLTDKFDLLVDKENNLVEPIEGFRICKIKPDIERFKASDFLLNTERFKSLYPDADIPMILQDNYQGRMKYIGDFWDKNQKVPSFVAEDWKLNERRLPGQEANYPWLTVSDFLEPYLIRLIYPIDKNCFYDGGLQGNGHTKNYVLPLTKTFFDFFKVKDLYERGGKVNLTMEKMALEAVKVRLEIKLKATEPAIVFERIYRNSVEEFPVKPDPTKKDGGSIVELQFGLNIMPFIKIKADDFNPLYKIQIIDRDVAHTTFSNSYSLGFFNEDNKEFDVKEPRTRRKKIKEKNTAETKYFTAEENFDYIQIRVGNYTGILIPKFPEREMGVDVFTFSVDFGTTNTHIEYRVNKGRIKPFEISENERFIANLHDREYIKTDPTFNNTTGTLIHVLIKDEWFPNNIKIGSANKFPFRTVLLDNQPNWQGDINAFSDVNPAFEYLFRAFKGDYKPTTDVKWSNLKGKDEKGKKIVGSFIESLLILIRNKVLLNDGNLNQTKLVWFYPQSMSENRLGSFNLIWQEKYKNIISKVTNPQSLSESIAPYFIYNDNNTINHSVHPAAIVDIGGGTTDFAVYFDGANIDDKKNDPVFISSARFAANSIFGDPFANSGQGISDDNGFVSKYKGLISNQLESLKLYSSLEVLENIADEGTAEDLIAFFFSLKDNPEVQKKAVIDFNEILMDDYSMKIVFLVFYCALIYHLAKLMKANNLPIPKDIAFSGNGSKVLSVLSPRNPSIEDLALIIFNKVYEIKTNGNKIRLVKPDEPKEITSKGGIYFAEQPGIDFTREVDFERLEALAELKKILKGTSDNSFVDNTKDKYENLTRNDYELVQDEVNNFYDLLFSVNDQLSFKNKLGVNTSDLESYKQILKSNILEDLKTCVVNKKNEVEVNEPLEETLFFYPIKCGISRLATYIAKQESK